MNNFSLSFIVFLILITSCSKDDGSIIPVDNYYTYGSGITMCKTSDGCLAVALQVNDIINILKVDQQLRILWTYNIEHYIGNTSICPTLDGGVCVAGANTGIIIPELPRLIEFHRFDGNGHLLWKQQYPLRNANHITMAQSVDGGFLGVTHVFNSFPSACDTLFVTKLSSGGDSLWFKKLINGNVGSTDKILTTSDSTFAITSYKSYFSINDKGEVKGIVTYDQEIMDMALNPDGSVLLSGWDDTIPALTKIDFSGNMIWQKTYTGNFGDSIVYRRGTHDICVNDNGESVFLVDQTKTIISKTDNLGNIINQWLSPSYGYCSVEWLNGSYYLLKRNLVEGDLVFVDRIEF